MRDSLRRALAGLLAVLLVSSAVGPVGTASAQFGEQPKNCSAVDKYVVMVTWSLGAGLTDCEFGTEVDPAEGAEASQVHSELYGSGLTSAENTDLMNSSISNYLEDTSTIAKMEGKNAFIESYTSENVTSEAEMKADARQGVDDYYSTHQITVLQEWAGQVRTVERIASSAESEENLSTTDVLWAQGDDDYGDGYQGYYVENVTVTLANGTDYTTPIPTVETVGNKTIKPWEDTGSSYWRSFVIAPNNDGTGTIGANDPGIPDESAEVLNNHKAVDRWQAIQTQITNQKQIVTDWANSTYDALEAGAVAPSELVDPYLGAREFDPTSSGQSWSTRSLTALGVTPPANMSNLERMEIVDDSIPMTVSGTLMTQNDPSNASGYTVGTTYNASKIPGHEFVATDDGPHKLTGQFRIQSASKIGGGNYSTGETIQWDRPDYQTADLSEFKNLSDQMMKWRAEFEAREQRTEENASSGTGDIFPDLGGLPFGGAGVAVVVLSLLGLAAVSRSN